MTGELFLYDIVGPKILPRWSRTTIVFVLVSVGMMWMVYGYTYAKKSEHDRADSSVENLEKTPLTWERYQQQLDALEMGSTQADGYAVSKRLYEISLVFLSELIGISLESLSAEELKAYQHVLGKDLTEQLVLLYTPLFMDTSDREVSSKKSIQSLQKYMYMFYKEKISSTSSAAIPGE